MKNKKRTRKKTLPAAVVSVIVIIICVTAAALLVSHVRTVRILDDPSSVFDDERYSAPVFIAGVDVIEQDVSCGYAVIEMFSAWAGGDITEESLYGEYGKVVTSTGRSFCEEMNRQFPEYHTEMHRYLTNTELINLVYDTLSRGFPVPFEWAAQYEGEWTLHYSLVTGMDIPNDRVVIANPYGYVEEISVGEFLERTSFEAYSGMPLWMKLGFAFGIFEKNTVFTVE